jgi:hypothetical protein
MMSISVDEHDERNQVLVTVSGEMSMKEMMEFIVAHRKGDQRDFTFLFDVSAATTRLSGDEMRQLAAYAAGEAHKAPIGPGAFISTDPYAYGICRMYQSYSTAEGRRNVGVFHNMAEAQTWLAGLKP